MVNCIIQDSQGFIWLGTKDGLNRYDGYDFKIYKQKPGDANSISDNFILAMAQDPEGIIWIGTDQGGLNAFDPKTQSFIHHRHDPASADSLPDDTVTALYVDRDGLLWVGTHAGLCRMERKTGRVERFSTPIVRGGLTPATKPAAVNAIYEDSRGYLWVGTNSSCFAFTPDRKTLLDFTNLPLGSTPPPDYVVNGFWELPDGNLLIASKDGLFRYDPERKLFASAYEAVIGRPAAIGVLGFRDRIWVGLGTSVMVINPATGDHHLIESGLGKPGRLSNGSINCWLEDRSGLLWLGTMIGVHVYDPDRRFHTFGVNEGLEVTATYGLVEDAEGHVWVGTNEGGVYRFDPETRSLHKVALGGFTEEGSDVYVLHHDNQGAVWIGHTNGLDMFYPESRQIVQSYRTEMKNPDDLSFPRVTDMLDHAGDEELLWVGTERGLNLLDKRSGRFQHILHNADDPNSMSGNDIQVLFRGTLQEDEGMIWIGLEDGGLNAFDPDRGTFRRYLPDPSRPEALSHLRVISMAESSGPRGRQLWIGTRGGGLNAFDPVTETFRHYRETDGLPNDTVYGILVDQAGYLWLSTNAGLARLEPGSGELISYDTFDGLRGREFNTGAYLKTGGGLFFFGGIEGVTYFDPNDIRPKTTPPPVVFTEFRLANKAVEVGGDSPLRRHISQARKITLNHRQPVFSFTFSALDFGAPMQNRYAYRMENFDEDWTETEADQRVATYTNLDAGTYRFRVKAANRDGFWNEEGASITLKILPSPWLSKWAYMGYILGFIGLLALYIHDQKRRLRAMNRKLEEKVKQRTKQLDGRIHELEALNRIINTIHRDIELPKVVETLMQQGLELFPKAERAAFLTPMGKRRYQVSHTVGYPSEVKGIVLDLSDTMRQDPLGRRVIRDDVYQLSGLRGIRTDKGEEFSASASVMAVRIKHETREIGVMVLSHSRDAAVFADVDLDTLLRYRDTMVSAVVKAKILQDLLEAQKALLASAHKAGMNEIAVHVLHNMGNALTSTHTSMGLIQELMVDDRSTRLLDKIRNLQQSADDADTEDRRRLITDALERIVSDWRRRTEKVVEESDRVREQLHQVTRNLWDRLELTREDVYSEPVRIDELVEEVLSLEGHLLHQEGIVIDLELARAPALSLNRAKLRRVLQCLLENAREAIARKDGNGRIRINSEEQTNRFLLVIADNGIGIAPEITPKVFFQGFSTKDGGRGMGLHYSVIAVEDMGGSIAVESDGLNQGTKVSIAFPYPRENKPEHNASKTVRAD